MKSKEKIIAVVFACLASMFLGITFLQATPLKVNVDFSLDKNGVSHQTTEAVLHGTPEQVWDLIYPAHRWKEYMPKISESFFVSPEAIQKSKAAVTNNAQ